MGSDLTPLLLQGENSAVEFKDVRVRPESLAREMVAFSNGSGGTILVGVDDSAMVHGLDDSRRWEEWAADVARSACVPSLAPDLHLVNWNGRIVLRIDVARGPHKPYQTVDGRWWVRVGSTNRQATREELSRLFQMAGLVHFDISPLDETGVRSLSMTAAASYFERVHQLDFEALSEEERTAVLRNADFLTELDGKDVCTVAGLLLFGLRPQKRLPQATVTWARVEGFDLTDSVIDRKTIEGPLPEQIDTLVALLRNALPEPLALPLQDARRPDSAALPLEVLREAVVNMVCHRDYAVTQGIARIVVYTDRLVFENPGRLPNTLTFSKVRAGNSAPRNIALVRAMNNLRYSDGLGRGIPRMVRLLGERLDLEEEGETFRLTMRLPPGVFR